MKKIKFRLFTLLMVMVLSISIFSANVMASGGGDASDIPGEVPSTETAEPAPLTPDGNLTLIDDIEGESTRGKQFVTLQSKAGNYFYLVIDRDGDKENVYFLNLVDEADLMALIDEPIATPEPEPEPLPAPEPEANESAEEQPEEDSESPPMLLLAILLVVGAGGGAFYYIKFIKKTPDVKGTTDLSEYDYDDDEDYSYTGDMYDSDEETTSSTK